MRTIAFITLWSLAAGGIGVMATAQNKPLPKQVERGKELFAKSPKGMACGTCHAIAGVGTAVAPDLKPLASVIPARGLVAAIKWQMAERVQDVKTPAGNFPGIQKAKTADEIEVWDLSQNPPELKKLPAKDVTMTRNEKWKHPGTTTEYTIQEMADIIGFLKWASAGQTREIKVDDIE